MQQVEVSCVPFLQLQFGLHQVGYADQAEEHRHLEYYRTLSV